MTGISAALDAAVLADAAYLELNVAPGQVVSGQALQTLLLATDRLTTDQARYISAHYELVAFESAGSGSFQAAVFRDTRVAAGAPGQYVLAIRGSAESQD